MDIKQLITIHKIMDDGFFENTKKYLINKNAKCEK